MEWLSQCKYPDLYACSSNKDALVSDCLDSNMNRGSKSWHLQFHSDFHDWELELVNSFLGHIYSQMPRGKGCDNGVCRGVGSFILGPIAMHSVAPIQFLG